MRTSRAMSPMHSAECRLARDAGKLCYPPGPCGPDQPIDLERHLANSTHILLFSARKPAGCCVVCRSSSVAAIYGFTSAIHSARSHAFLE